VTWNEPEEDEPRGPERIYDIAGTLPEPEKELENIDNSYILSQALGITPSFVYKNYDDIIEQINAAEAQKHDYNVFGAFWHSFKQSLAEKPAMMMRGIGTYHPKVDPLMRKASDYLRSLQDPVEKEKVQEIMQDKLWPKREGDKWFMVEPELLPSVMETWAAHFGDFVPLILTTKVGELTATGMAALIAGGVGMATVGPDPTDTVVVPTVYKVTKEVMRMLGGATPLIMIEAGGFMEYAEALGIDRDISEKYARYYGSDSVCNETVQTHG
jgi:hypothetical protein